MGRSPCCDKNGLKKGPWTPEEDAKLTQYIQAHGAGNWRSLPKNAGLQRCGKSCRLRWTNYLRPDIKRGRFSFEEEETIIQLHGLLGNKWSAIAARLPGRTDNEIKNYWNTHIRKRLLRQGIDPVTHAPRLDLLDLSSLLASPPQLSLPNLLRLQAALLNPEAVRLAASLFPTNGGNHVHVAAPFFQPNQFENIIDQQIPPNIDNSFRDQSQSLPMHSINSDCCLFQDNLIPTTMNSNCSSSNTTNNNSQNFSFDNSVMSTPLSSPPALNSEAAFIGGATAEDERESFCSSLLKFEIPDGFNFDDFM